MSFASAEYLPFLALCLALFQFAPRRARTLFVAAASYGFYAWWSVPHLLLLLGSTLVDYSVALRLAGAEDPVRRRRWLALSLVFNLGPLALFKYSGLVLETLAPLLGTLGIEAEAPGWALPLGISFYTFQTLGYTLDVYRGRLEPCRSLVSFATYVAFFPQLVAGPIERAKDLLPQVQRLQLLTTANLSLGVRLILWGLLKKRVLADRLGGELWPLFLAPDEHGALTLWLVASGMYVLLYLDFSAYTDIARGSARLFGVGLVQNFNAPFVSTSVTEFARRWHMSLFNWISEYVHGPLSRGRLTHATLWRANLVTMGLFGLWHGASWRFLLWGLWAGALISLEHSTRLSRARRGARPGQRTALGVGAGWLYANAVSALAIVLFFAPALAHVGRYWSALFAAGQGSTDWSALGRVAGILGILFTVHALGARLDLERAWTRIGWAGRLLWFTGLTWAVLRWFELLNRPFIYFQF